MNLYDYVSQSRRCMTPPNTSTALYKYILQVLLRTVNSTKAPRKFAAVYSLEQRYEYVIFDGEPYLIIDQSLMHCFHEFNSIMRSNEVSTGRIQGLCYKYLSHKLLTLGQYHLAFLLAASSRVVRQGGAQGTISSKRYLWQTQTSI